MSTNLGTKFLGSAQSGIDLVLQSQRSFHLVLNPSHPPFVDTQNLSIRLSHVHVFNHVGYMHLLSCYTKYCFFVSYGSKCHICVLIGFDRLEENDALSFDQKHNAH
jgi:hypothetical protein